LLEKCKKHNMWLFIEKTIPFEHVERVLHSWYICITKSVKNVYLNWILVFLFII
jgi:hypothetical protein